MRRVVTFQNIFRCCLFCRECPGFWISLIFSLFQTGLGTESSRYQLDCWAKMTTRGIKWISSFPGNHLQKLPRASAVIILNDMNTGFPYACIEGSRISAARTAASAALGARLLHRRNEGQRLGVIGCGLISGQILSYLLQRWMGIRLDQPP
jgi:ornithine cyclodeaminase/alanine dehydrogenase-like protein (mu-crystallin family)